MAYQNTISIVINAIDNASKVVDSAAAQIKTAQDTVAASSKSSAATISTALDSAGQKMVSTGQSMTRYITLPAIVALGATAKMAYDFQNQMELLRTSAGIPQSQIASLSNQVLQMAGEVGQAPEKLAQGLYHIASAGNGIWNTSQMLDILKTASIGANLGMADLDSTTYALSSAMASGVKGAKDASEMMATLNAIVGAGDMKMQDLNGAISTGVLSTMATAGISVQSFGAALATLTDNGEHADEAATRLRMSISLMTSPSSMATKQLEALGLTAENAKVATDGMNAVFAKSGLSTTKLADDLRSPNGISVAIEDLKKHLEDAGLSASETDAMLSKAFGGGRTDAAILTMLQNTTRMDDKFKAITTSASDFNNKMNDLNQTAGQKFRDSWSGVQADLTKLGESVLPEVTRVLQQAGTALGVVTTWFSKLSPWQKQAIVDLTLFAAVAGPALVILGTMARSISAIIALGPALSAFFSGFASVAMGAITVVRTGVMTLFATIGAGAVMGGIAIAGALADIALVAKAIASVQGAIDALNAAKASAANYSAAKASTHQELLDLSANGDPGQKQRANALLSQGYALGTNFAATDSYIAGENGPELITNAKGSKVLNNRDTQKLMGGNKTVHIGQMNINNNIDVGLVMRELGWKLALA